MEKKDSVSVKFSGGKDSTLTAYLMTDRFEKVHLLTYKQGMATNEANSKINAEKLKDMFGKDRIIHEIIDVDELFEKLLLTNYYKDMLKYKTFLAACVGCGVCKLAMHARTIEYNLENDIKYSCDGINVTGFDQSQQKWIAQTVTKLYEDYDMDYFSPVYDLPRTDLELFKIGLKAPKPTFFYGAQGNCCGSTFHNVYLRFYFLPLHGKKRYEEISTEYWKEKMELCRKYINQSVKKMKH